MISSAYQQAQLRQGNFTPDSISVGDLFAGALLPGLLLVLLYIVYVLVVAWWRPQRLPAPPAEVAAAAPQAGAWRVLRVMIAPLVLILAVLGSIIGGYATPTEAAAVGAGGALLLALVRGGFGIARLREVMQGTVRLSSMVFLIMIGAAMFSLVFRGLGGDVLVHELLSGLPGGTGAAVFIVMLALFLLGFIIDFIEITYIVVPIVAPTLLALGLDPVWLGIMIAVNLQTSFLTPPFGFALFYLRGVAPPEVRTADIYRGVVPFVAIQLAALVALWFWPQLTTWLPELFYGG